MVEFLSALIFTIDVIAAILLIGIVLIQQSKSGGGLGAISGGSSSVGESVFGPAAGNVITRVTVVLATVFLVSTLFLVVLSKYQRQPEGMGERLEREDQQEELEKTIGESEDAEEDEDSE